MVVNQSNQTAIEEFPAFLKECHSALREQTHGHPKPYLELWSHEDDVVFLSPMGGKQLGYQEVSGLLTAVAATLDYTDWAATNFATYVGEELAFTSELEQVSRPVGSVEGSAWPDELGLRVTSVYRWEEGRWRVIYRHANAYEELDFPAYVAPR